MVTLDKPIGIRFALNDDGCVYVDALAKKVHDAAILTASRDAPSGRGLCRAHERRAQRPGEATAALSATQGNAEASRLIMVGDILKKTSAVFGDAMTTVDDFGRVMYTIKARSGPVSLIFERPAQACIIRPVLPKVGWHDQSAGRVGLATWRLPGGQPRATAAVRCWEGQSLEGQGSAGLVSFSTPRLPGRNGAAAGDPWDSLDGEMVDGEDADIGRKGAEAVAAYEAKGRAAAGADKPWGEAADKDAQQRLPRPFAWPGPPALGDDADRGDLAWSNGIEAVEEYNDAVRRAESDLLYPHALGMNYTEVTPSLYLGSCLQSPADVRVLGQQLALTAILNLQLSSDQVNWGIDGDALLRAAREEGVIIVHQPIRDFDPHDLRMRLPYAVAVLHRLLRKGHRVYVSCTAGLGRAPTCVIAYLHWILGMCLREAHDFVTKLRPSAPNRSALVGATWDLLALARAGRKGGLPTHAVQLAWNHGGREVLLVGEFEGAGGWNNPIAAVPVGGPKFVTNLRLPQGKYNYKFIVDGQWRHAIDLPMEPDEWGNMNNVIHVGLTSVARHQSASRTLYSKDVMQEAVLERPLTSEERRLLTYVAHRMAFQISHHTFAPKM
eukprot:SM000140S00614  [mRNA]  locus=s140:308234:311238:+ [translate_table: standard]